MTFHHVFPQVSRFPGIRYHPQVGRQKIQKNASCWGRQLESHPLIECRPWENHLTVAEIHYSYIYIILYYIYCIYIICIIHIILYKYIFMLSAIQANSCKPVFFLAGKKRFEKAQKKEKKIRLKKNRKKAIGKKKKTPKKAI